MSYIYSNIIGSFLIDDELNITKEELFKSLDDYKNKEKFEKKLAKKSPKAKRLNKKQLTKVLVHFKEKKYFNEYYKRNLEITKKAIRKAVNVDNLILQTISNVNDLDKTSNVLVKRLRDWYNLTFPELDKAIGDHEKYAELVATKTKKELLKDLGIKEEDSMGAKLEKQDQDEIKLLAVEAYSLYKLRKAHEVYLKKLMEKHCPNLLEICGVTIGAKLFEHAKTLRHLALLPSSTIQLLGAEKALFRHIKTGAPPPKYGVIFTHPLVQRAWRKDQGRVARSLASKISIAVRVDFFKGEFIGDKLKKELETKFRRK
jgi:nucleolar protein 56